MGHIRILELYYGLKGSATTSVTSGFFHESSFLGLLIITVTLKNSGGTPTVVNIIANFQKFEMTLLKSKSLTTVSLNCISITIYIVGMKCCM